MDTGELRDVGSSMDTGELRVAPTARRQRRDVGSSTRGAGSATSAAVWTPASSARRQRRDVGSSTDKGELRAAPATASGLRASGADLAHASEIDLAASSAALAASAPGSAASTSGTGSGP